MSDRLWSRKTYPDPMLFLKNVLHRVTAIALTLGQGVVTMFGGGNGDPAVLENEEKARSKKPLP